MSKTRQPDVDYKQFEQAGPDIRMLASQVRAVENAGARNTLLRAIQVLLGKRAGSDETEDKAPAPKP
jgi:hypothetical protein